MPIFYRWVIAVLTCVAALPTHAGEPQAGIAGVADRKATVNFTDLARQEARAALAPRTPKVVHSPMPGPKEPADRVSPPRDESRAAAPAEAGPAPLSPAPASSFLALADDTTAIQNAINAAGAGDAIIFPSGTYVVTGLTVAKRITLMGWGGAMAEKPLFEELPGWPVRSARMMGRR